MTYYLLPASVSTNLYQKINLQFDSEPSECLINESLHEYLSKIKLKISELETWDTMKKYTNPYEYIHTTIPGSRSSVCKFKPLSRSYFKMIEMIRSLYLLDGFGPGPVHTFHLAEGPGGFIEAVRHVRIVEHHAASSDELHGMTLVEESEHVPGWKKSREFLDQNPQVKIEVGKDGTGDVLSPDNLEHNFRQHRNSMHLVTGDGGFDFSSDFLNQESSAAELIFGQIAHGVLMQKKGGHMVIKLFDAFTRPTIEMIYLLTGLYKKVYVIKPNTSRYANSERYLVCKGFRLDDSSDLFEVIMSAFRKIGDSKGLRLKSVLGIRIPHYFITRLEEYNAIIGQQQIETINSTLQLIAAPFSVRNEKIEHLKKNNIMRCTQWCSKNRQSYNKSFGPTNIFLTRAQNTSQN